MQFSFLFASVSIILVLIAATDLGTTVKIRIEGSKNTIYESTIFTRGQNVTTKSGGTHRCDGTNLNSSSKAGPTATSALADAAKHGHFFWDADFYSKYDDFYITRIGDDQSTLKQWWGILVNFKYIPVGGCQQRVQLNNEVLFAYDAFSKKYFLKLTGPLAARRSQTKIFTVTDGSTGVPISGANVGKQLSDENGHVKITFTSRGRMQLKAERNDSIRSNAVFVQVK
ncbi:unnamed protein product [Rotaria sp. Silwood2]|nr:unnamed protein product [Rotaria sp. Silwood2]CAF3313506.1 unnamed protein product [Rotaria sp. Silwood2]CAF3321378.1 unnamed protein product [Rotaria sp. Silwood2]CAF3897904.1 unnamed protein product [Rotaria sp. Silwood2]CAF4089847.1 unnamed protein product [Rotaria sp. Silwood2]